MDYIKKDRCFSATPASGTVYSLPLIKKYYYFLWCNLSKCSAVIHGARGFYKLSPFGSPSLLNEEAPSFACKCTTAVERSPLPAGGTVVIEIGAQRSHRRKREEVSWVSRLFSRSVLTISFVLCSAAPQQFLFEWEVLCFICNSFVLSVKRMLTVCNLRCKLTKSNTAVVHGSIKKKLKKKLFLSPCFALLLIFTTFAFAEKAV